MAKKQTRSEIATQDRKQRTREHVIADQSLNHVEYFVFQCGFTANREFFDYGYDLGINTFNENGFVEPGTIRLQLKASDDISRFALQNRPVFSFHIDRRDLNLWTKEIYPVYFVFYDALNEKAYWQDVNEYFRKQTSNKITRGNLSIHVPKKNVLRQDTIHLMQERKNKILGE